MTRQARILFCGDGGAEDTALLQQLAGFGHAMVPVEGLKALRTLLSEPDIGAIVLACGWQASDGDTQHALEILEAMPAEARPPILMLGDDSGLPVRLKAVRAGARAYLIRPASPMDVIDRLEQILEDDEARAFRVLLVDDDPRQTRFYHAILEQAGVRVLSLNDPMQILGPLTDFRPELVLIDLYMPGVRGAELAAAIRQDPAHVSIPIVYLSSEDDKEKQHLAMRVGGDDFLVKPIKPEHLVSAVKNRARRFRELRALMLRDSLTGLLNQASTREHLAVELARMRRSSQPLAFAMIDIDHFKAVNDTHGHPTGDRVIRSLANLLKQRLRTTDVLGRFGGEEFAVALTGTPPDAAFVVMEEVRRAFEAMDHRGQHGGFRCTFSCGLAFFPDQRDVAPLIEAADKALYKAKAAGRNRVGLA